MIITIKRKKVNITQNSPLKRQRKEVENGHLTPHFITNLWRLILEIFRLSAICVMMKININMQSTKNASHQYQTIRIEIKSFVGNIFVFSLKDLKVIQE